MQICPFLLLLTSIFALYILKLCCVQVCSINQSCPTLCDLRGLQPARLLCPWSFPGKNTGVGCHFLFQGIFPTQGSNLHLLGLLHYRWIFYQLSHRGRPNLAYYCKINAPPWLHQCLTINSSLWLLKVFHKKTSIYPSH